MSASVPLLSPSTATPHVTQPRPLSPLIIPLLLVFALGILLYGRSGPVKSRVWTDVDNVPSLPKQPHIWSPSDDSLRPSVSDGLTKGTVPQAPAEGDMQDAEVYLQGAGILGGLPELHVQYGKLRIRPGAQFRKATDAFLQSPPAIAWDEALGPCTVVVLDPDAPAPAPDRSTAGRRGPWLHLLVTDAVGRVSKGREVVEYAAPTPPQGNHRYIFVLFQQPARVRHVGNDRARWDVEGFLRANPELRPAAINYFYVAA